MIIVGVYENTFHCLRGDDCVESIDREQSQRRPPKKAGGRYKVKSNGSRTHLKWPLRNAICAAVAFDRVGGAC